MSREFPDRVDPWKAADGRRTFRGTMPLKRMQRLVPLLADGLAADVRDAIFSARFSHDEQGRVEVSMDVEAVLPLLCQRSLEPFEEPVRRLSVLVVIEDLADEEALSDSEEAVLAENGRLDLLQLVEDELLLAVPQVPRNPSVREVELSTDGAVSSPSVSEIQAGAAGQSRKPFAGLAELLKEKG